jgi:hypothetical protein
MPGEFEKEMQERMQDFRISPGPQVWKQVEAAMPEEKRKRRFAFWWWLPLGLLVGGGIWYAVGGNKASTIADNQQPLQVTQPINSFKETNENKVITTPATVAKQEDRAINTADANNNSVPQTTNEDAVKRNEVPQTNNNVAVRSKKVPQTTNEDAVKSNEVLQTNNKVAVRNKKLPQTTNEDAVKRNELLQTNNKVALRSKKVPETNNEVLQRSNKTGVVDNTVKDEEPPVLQSAAAKPNNIASKDAVATADSAINALPETAVVNPELNITQNPADTAATVASEADKTLKSSAQNKKTKQVSWQFFASAGISNTKSAFLGSMNKSLEFASPLNLVASNPGNINSTPQQSTPGFSYAAGIERLQKISKHWQWYTSAQYSYLSNHQKTGARKDSGLTLFDNAGLTNSSSRNGATVPGFYYSGSSISHTNTIHQLGLQTGLQYTLNPAGKKPISIRGGLMANWQVATTQLLYDGTKGVYYYSKDATHHFTMGTQLGFDWKLAQQFSIGAFFQYNFTRIAKPELGTNLHWKMSGIRIAVPLRKMPPKPSFGGLKK